MTLVYLLLGFTGLTGAAIAKDEYAKLEAPNDKDFSELTGKHTTSDSI